MRVSSWPYLGRAFTPAIAGSLAAGVGWWIMADLPDGSRWSVRGLGWFVQSLYLLLITTAIPNLLGLAVLSRWLSRRHQPRLLAQTVLALLGGAIYGGAMLVAGVIVGVAVFLMPMIFLMPPPAVANVVGTLFLIREFYPVAALGGIVSVTGLIQKTSRPSRFPDAGTSPIR